jgi:ATP-binding cassette, subfamily B (MDR/TAP), member 1
LLDEATSALDSESELVVQNALDNILQQKKLTTIIIAHRLSTIRNADVINVVHEGKVVESGTHGELMNKQGYYFRLVQTQDGKINDNSDSGPSSRVSSSADLIKLVDKAASNESTHGIAHIEFKKVTFAYPTRPKKIVFNDFSLKISQGMTIGLVGPSVEGKSTTVGLIERFYDPLDGVVEFKGHDIKSLNLSWYRDQIGYVGQEPTLSMTQSVGTSHMVSQELLRLRSKKQRCRPMLTSSS